MDTTVLLLAVVVVVLFAIVGWLLYDRRRSNELRSTFGPEYQRAVRGAGSRRAAEADLLDRRRRVETLQIRPLSIEEHDRFAVAWREIQSRFVDEPEASIAQADDLIQEAMEARGYPVADFEQRVADVSVDHPAVVEHYRAAHRIAEEQAGRTSQDTATRID